MQAVFWGHPTTSGVGGHAVDYYLLMDGAEPGDVELPSGRYSEQLVRLDTMGAYYRKNESGQLRASASRGAYAANSTTLRAVDGRRRLYACPQHCLKFHPDFDAALLGILDADPDALIVLKDCANLAAGPGVVERLVAKGAAPKSLLVVGRVSLEEYVKIFGGSHVALEPFPFGGSITTLDSFEAGTPVIAKAPEGGGRPALTAALYDIAGVDCCVARDAAAYVALAVAVASDPARRAAASAAIAAGRGALYESAAGVREVGAFLDRALRVAGPPPPGSS